MPEGLVRNDVAMDWESALSSAVGTAITIVATGAVTLLSVSLKGRFDLRQQQATIDAENERLRIEHDRQELLSSAEQEVESNRARRANADRLLETLAAILEGLSVLPDDAPFEDVEERWNREYDARARRAVELLSDSDLRLDMQYIMDSLANFGTFATANDLKLYGGWNGRLLLHLLIELAGTAARGEQRSDGLVDRVREHDARFEKFAAHVDAQYAS